MAPTTLPGQKTTTSPYGRDVDKTGAPLRGTELVAAIAPPGTYVARGTVGDYNRLKQYLKKALQNQLAGGGFSFVEGLSTCPTRWRTNAKETWGFLRGRWNVILRWANYGFRAAPDRGGDPEPWLQKTGD